MTEWMEISDAINNSVGFYLWTQFAVMVAQFGLVLGAVVALVLLWLILLGFFVNVKGRAGE